MKIAAIYTQSVGPLGNAEISFKNDWTGEVEDNVLLTGPNGCGKSTLLRGAAILWDALGYWLDHKKTMSVSHSARKWLERWGTFAVVFSDLKCSNQSPIRIDEQLRTIVHGKKFYKAIVPPAFMRLLTIPKAISVDVWFREMPEPADLDFIWHEMNLPVEEN